MQKNKAPLSFSLIVFTALFFDSARLKPSSESSPFIKMLAAEEKVKTLRSIASINGLRPAAKGSSIVNVEITRLDDREVQAGTPLTLEAKVEAVSDLNDLEFVWLLPEGVRVENGQVSGQLGTLAQGAVATLQINLLQELDGNRQVNLHVFRRVNGEAQGYMAQYNTVLQPTLDSIIAGKAEALNRAPASINDSPNDSASTKRQAVRRKLIQ